MEMNDFEIIPIKVSWAYIYHFLKKYDEDKAEEFINGLKGDVE